ncbi:Phosphatidylinositide phosphatase SAC2 [Halotydeus destructor]|nr:Phosphatidylinositide phosphatase SAC2 [Halotydeus destructor]
MDGVSGQIEVYRSSEFVVLKHGQYSLWCPRASGDGEMKFVPKLNAKLSDDISYSGTCHGLLGIFDGNKLAVISHGTLIGRLPNHKSTQSDVYKIKSIAVISLGDHDSNDDLVGDLELEADFADKFQPLSPSELNEDIKDFNSSRSSNTVQKTWSTIKNVSSQVKQNSKMIIKATQSAHQSDKLSDPKERFERRIQEELLKMFNDTDSFYYCPDGDLTNSMQRLYSNYDAASPIWHRLDERFFWNKHMVSDLITLSESGHKSAGHWIMPIIQGFVQIERSFIDASTLLTPAGLAPPGDHSFSQHLSRQDFSMVIISRRSRHRAGTRYKRRGVDEEGHTANYVETEQMFIYNEHIVSFVQVRGSVPVFWSQPGYSYRPPPRLDRTEDISQNAFKLHFDKELGIYEKETIINLVERSGREKIIGDAYLNHVLKYDSDKLAYVSFDFHDYCRGMRFENVSLLIENLKEHIKESRFCWIDSKGLICSQVGTFRVNCIDCLDRTNVVQTAIARTVMDLQLTRLGLLPPEGVLPHPCRRLFQTLWANNGDTISRQYAGTAALKGDYTRTGERKISGALKDSMNSASRYYQNRFKDAYRQATIDMMLGHAITDKDLHSPDNDAIEENDNDRHERVKQVIEDCKKSLIPDHEIILGGWPLIDADPGNGPISASTDMNTVLILTKDSYYVSEYDDQTDRIIRYQSVLLDDLEKIEFGSEPVSNVLSASRVRSFVKSSSRQSHSYCIRLHYVIHGQAGYFHMLKPTDTRFFNNLAIQIKTPEEEVEALKAICESFKVALSVRNINVPFYEGRLERRKSKPLSSSSLSNRAKSKRQNRLQNESGIGRNFTDTNLNTLKNVGSKAFSGMSNQFAKLKIKMAPKGISQSLTTFTEPCDVVSDSLTTVSSYNGEDDTDNDDFTEAEEECSLFESTIHEPSAASSSLFLRGDQSSSNGSTCSVFDQEGEAVIAESSSIAFCGQKLDTDTLLESCGILTTAPYLRTQLPSCQREPRRSLLDNVDDFVIDSMKRASLRNVERIAKSECLFISKEARKPRINVEEANILSESLSTCSGSMSSVSRPNVQSLQMSRSSEGIDYASQGAESGIDYFDTGHCSLDYNLVNRADKFLGVAKMKNSASETCIQDRSNMADSTMSLAEKALPPFLSAEATSPLMVKKDFVSSPLSRIARGVQNLGLRAVGHLPPVHRKSNSNMVDSESLKVLKLKSKTKIMEL